MSLPLAILRQTLGARVLKTGLAVFAALALSQALNPRYAVYAGFAAFLAVQPSLVRSRATMQQQLIGNALGATIGAALAYLLGHGPLAMSVGVILLLVVLRWLHLPESINLAVVMLLFILERSEGEFLNYGLYRIGAVFLGTLIGYLVNRWIAPPDYRRQLHVHLAAAGVRMDALLVDVAGRLYRPNRLGKPAIKAAAAAIQRELDLARHHLRLAEEDGSASGETLHKAINSIGVFMERTMDLHKALLLALPLDAEAVAAVGVAMDQLRVARGAVYSRFPLAVTRATAETHQTLAAVRDRLRALADSVNTRVQSPELRANGLALHSLWVNLEHMCWRLESLQRFLDAEPVAGGSLPAAIGAQSG